MYNWIEKGGRVQIFSRDLSWAQDRKMKAMLREKARKRELCLCLPQSIPLVDELEPAGAEVTLYPELDYIPQSRFTMVNWGRMDQRVAIGRLVDDAHVIEELSNKDVAYFVAKDLIEILLRFNKVKSEFSDHVDANGK
jgi:hypothetical protein